MIETLFIKVTAYNPTRQRLPLVRLQRWRHFEHASTTFNRMQAYLSTQACGGPGSQISWLPRNGDARHSHHTSSHRPSYPPTPLPLLISLIFNNHIDCSYSPMSASPSGSSTNPVHIGQLDSADVSQTQNTVMLGFSPQHDHQYHWSSPNIRLAAGFESDESDSNSNVSELSQETIIFFSEN